MESQNLTLSHWEHSKELECPQCGDNNLHQGKCSVYWREKEDSTAGLQIQSNESREVSINLHVEGNPSDRRDGIRIEFWCEGCDVHPSLAIVQHKGKTFVYWEAWKGVKRFKNV